MKIDLVRKLPEHPEIVAIYQKEGGKLDTIQHWLPEPMFTAISKFVETEKLTFKAGDCQIYYYINKTDVTKFILLGMGKSEQLMPDKVRKYIADIVKQSIKLNGKQIYVIPGFDIPLTDAMFGQVLAEASLLAAYKFEKYRSESKYTPPDALHLVLESSNTRNINKGILQGRILAETANLARDLVNEPSNMMYPDSLAEAAKKAALQYGFSVEVYTLDKLRRLKMEAFLAVAKGSKNEPRLIIMRHLGNPEIKNETIALIGKGLTYDSGGYCIKQPASMLNMKNDMAGAAAVIGTMSAIATLKLKLNVVGIIAACENMISGEAYRPGDIIRSMSGKTIEVHNTDAEGRLTLIDAIHFAIEREHAVKIIDIATLTGAAVGALGSSIAAVVTNDQQWYEKLEQASKITGEIVWQLPNFEEYKELIKSEIADLKNVGGQWAGAITAALFIQEFVQNLPWLHIDMAGNALKDKENGYYAYGGTGWGVRLLTTLLELME